MTADEFRKAYNCRQCEKCCANCRHGIDHMYDGCVDCVHPDVKDEHMISGTEDVCDKWEKA